MSGLNRTTAKSPLADAVLNPAVVVGRLRDDAGVCQYCGTDEELFEVAE
jgi:hypothetical protein